MPVVQGLRSCCADLSGKVSQNGRHFHKGSPGSGHLIQGLHHPVIDRQEAALDRIASRGLAEKIGEDLIIGVERFVEAVERGGFRLIAQGFLDAGKAQLNRGCDLQSVIRVALTDNQQAGAAEPVNEQYRRNDADNDACQQMGIPNFLWAPYRYPTNTASSQTYFFPRDDSFCTKYSSRVFTLDCALMVAWRH